MNEAETRADLIDPLLRQAGWGIVPESRVLREHHITKGRILSKTARGPRMIADYILVYKNRKMAVIEAKSIENGVEEGVAQAKLYANKLDLDVAYACDGKAIYSIHMRTGREGVVQTFPTPEELERLLTGVQDEWQAKFDSIPFETVGGTKSLRFYQEIAVNRALESIAGGKKRILLTLATGTGKTFIAFQIVWKLFQSRWNLQQDGGRRPRILFLADRNILAKQAYNGFQVFPEDAMVRVTPAEIRKHQKVPTNASIFFTIFQTFMCGPQDTPYFGDYPRDFFDIVIVDECHRGGAQDESTWREILEHFSPAVHIGLTATPKRKDNVDTYRYFGEPVYKYSLKEGIQDGFLTPFRVRRFQTTMDEYVFTSDDNVVEGEVEEGKVYVETDFNRIIEIKEREAHRVKLFMEEIDRNQKTLVFCASQHHAAVVRDLINQQKFKMDGFCDPHYCVRVTANDGLIGEQFLREFQDNEKTIPTILTTSQKLSTGVDALNIRNIVLMRTVNSMIEFKQIVGRGTRLYEGKEFFTIYDFVGAYKMFADPEWDGEPTEEIEEPKPRGPIGTPVEPPTGGGGEPGPVLPMMVKIRLADGKDRQIQHITTTLVYGPDGNPISIEEFITKLFGELPKLFSNETDLKEQWGNPESRKLLLEKLSKAGFGEGELKLIQEVSNASDGDTVDVLAYIAFSKGVIPRSERVEKALKKVEGTMSVPLQQFIEFVLDQYLAHGVSELDLDKLPDLLTLKYKSNYDAEQHLGDLLQVKDSFIGFQKYLYE